MYLNFGSEDERKDFGLSDPVQDTIRMLQFRQNDITEKKIVILNKNRIPWNERDTYFLYIYNQRIQLEKDQDKTDDNNLSYFIIPLSTTISFSSSFADIFLAVQSDNNCQFYQTSL